MTVRIEIDPNVRVRGNQTYASLDDADGPVAVGDRVLAWESEAKIIASARVTDIDSGRDLIYLAVDWKSFRDMEDQ